MRLTVSKLASALVLLVLLATGAVQAQDLSKEQRNETRRFAANNSLFVLYHEIGHLLFDQLELPVLGREEDAADNMATWTLLNRADARSEKTLTDSAQGWLLSGVAYDSGGDESDYAAGHSLDKQRAYQIVCLMVGKDDTAYRRIANEYRIDRDRQESCYWDYDMVKRSFDKLLGSRSMKTGATGTEVIVTYHDVGGRLKAAADAFKSSGIFEEVAEELRTKYSVRVPVRFNAKRCGEANAFYDPDTVEVIFCYELMQDYMDLYTKNLFEQGAVPRSTGDKTKNKNKNKTP
ncbi:DUF4344 domain-containing metallopeptidase [Devosia sp. 2618]|uniref:DUF4344 domain-containing metallopeptidase n=1 Tax=Devosia sp. 2618 TaxID=3156454 RepID=UPI003392D715